jgi:hypothetical protein
MERDFPFSAAIFRCRDAAKGGSPAASLAAQSRIFPSLSRRLLAGQRETRSATRVAPAARWLYRRRLGGKRDREPCQRAAGVQPAGRRRYAPRLGEGRFLRLDLDGTNARGPSRKSSRRGQNLWVSRTEDTERSSPCPQCLCGSNVTAGANVTSRSSTRLRASRTMTCPRHRLCLWRWPDRRRQALHPSCPRSAGCWLWWQALGTSA